VTQKLSCPRERDLRIVRVGVRPPAIDPKGRFIKLSRVECTAERMVQHCDAVRVPDSGWFLTMDTLISRSIFSSATGYIRRGGFEWTCNPYVGCTFGCTYCYAMFLPQNRRPKEEWGRWLQAKSNAVELARRTAHKVAGQAVYMSSVTDPYLPAEGGLRLSRGILEAMLPHQPRLLVQTRGPLVERDFDLLQTFGAVRLNMSIPTDSEAVRRAFEPKAPPLERRWEVIHAARAVGIRVGICVTPMLPLGNPSAFIERLVAFDPEVLVTQDFHDSHGGFGANTGPKARGLLNASRWSAQSYQEVVDALRRKREVFEGETGFFPPGEHDYAASSTRAGAGFGF
jgi:DNA repair photolyase